jgi:hypothetical protein
MCLTGWIAASFEGKTNRQTKRHPSLSSTRLSFTVLPLRFAHSHFRFRLTRLAISSGTNQDRLALSPDYYDFQIRQRKAMLGVHRL